MKTLNDVEGECCEYMQSHIDNQDACDSTMHASSQCPDVVLRKDVYEGRVAYKLPVHDGGLSYYPITYCPFCGYKIGFDQDGS